MILRHPSTTRTHTLFPYTTLFRSPHPAPRQGIEPRARVERIACRLRHPRAMLKATRSEEHTSELQSLMRISYAVFCLKKKKTNNHKHLSAKHNIHQKSSPTLEQHITNKRQRHTHSTNTQNRP